MTREEHLEQLAKARANITPAQRIENGRKGAMIQQQNRMFKDIINKMLNDNCTNKQKAKMIKSLGYDGKRIENICDTLITKAEHGDSKAIAQVFEMSGQSAKEATSETMENAFALFDSLWDLRESVDDEED